MKTALIATLFNEADNVTRWWDSLMRQTVKPDVIAVVDGGSTDGTFEKLQELAGKSPVPVRLEQRRCNIAQGRNRAIALAGAEIIAASDAGSFPDAQWFGEIIRPLLESPQVDVVGGRSRQLVENDFHRFLASMEPMEPPGPGSDQSQKIYPSSRNIAFRREAWSEVGGYPEWLTLTAEDALFNFQLHLLGKKFFYNPAAVVRWALRDTAEGYYRMLYGYGYGAAEARLYAPYFLRRGLIALFPPLLLLSRHRFRHLKFRYLKNYSSARGWVAGRFWGNRPPPGWRRINGVLLSPEGQDYRLRNRQA
jgi:cellulose synthase/poly-beta-1,6-N-acetylglucosamine synthase-like glycosyltransferase